MIFNAAIFSDKKTGNISLPVLKFVKLSFYLE